MIAWICLHPVLFALIVFVLLMAIVITFAVVGLDMVADAVTDGFSSFGSFD